MSVFTPKRIERGESWQPLTVLSDQDDLSIPSYSVKSQSPDSDIASTRSLGNEVRKSSLNLCSVHGSFQFSFGFLFAFLVPPTHMDAHTYKHTLFVVKLRT